MKLVVIAPPVLPVPPVHYGGIERIVHHFCREAAQRGHVVHLMAGQGSRDYGGGVTVHRAPTRRWVSRAFRKIVFQFRLVRVARGSQVVINFWRPDYCWALARSGKPLVHWWQNPVAQYEVDIVARWRNRHLVFVSEDQRSGFPMPGPHTVIPNCIDTEVLLPARVAVPQGLLFLGRLTRNKGAHTAIEVAAQAGENLTLAGNVSREPGGAEFFAQQIAPRVGPRWRWVGEVDDAAKRPLLQGARALLFPIEWREPFGIVMIEALACGTPVIAFDRGAVREVVRHGVTGFICRDVDEMVAAVHRIGELDRAACRRDAVERFSIPAFWANCESMLHRAFGADGRRR